jgi:protein-S-isoprenylcysteine O-methyltransferase Ste14
VLLLVAGMTIMVICIRRYFFDLSGIKVFVSNSHSSAKLQTDGLHNIVRHPLYFGTLLFIWGCFLLFPYLSNLIACSLITIYTIIGIKMEERKLVIEFGERYKYYAGKVPMLIPRLFVSKRRLRQQLS